MSSTQRLTKWIKDDIPCIFAKYDSIFNEIKQKIENDSNTMILFSGGMGAKYLLSELHKLYPNAIYIDVGSAFDTISTGRYTRSCYSSYNDLKQYLNPIMN